MKYSFIRTMQTGFVLALMAVSATAAAQGNADTEGDTKGETDKAAVDTAKLAAAQKAPYGAYLVDAAGWSVYLFKADAKAEGSTCYDACAKMWPPLLTSGPPLLGGMTKDKLNEELLGTIERKNGSTQVTYNGWPLYYFVKDDEPGATNGQDIKGFGAEWYLLTPDGTPVHAEEHSSSEGHSSSKENSNGDSSLAGY